MRSELEKLIAAHREAFDTECLPDGHQERFSARLAESVPRETISMRKPYRRTLAAIAALAAVVTLAVMVVKPLGEGPGSFDPEFMEAADYFAFALRNKAEQVKALAVHIEPAHRGEILADIEMLSHLNIEQLPQAAPSEEERLGLLFEHYRAKASSLEMIENSITNIPGHTAD